MSATLLVVDDNHDLIQTTTRELSEARPDWKLFLGYSCSDARKMMKHARPDAAILDVGLPDGNGLDLMSELILANREMPVIMMSGSASDEMRLKVLDRGGYALIEKPFSLGRLVSNVERALPGSSISRLKNGVSLSKSKTWKNPAALCCLPAQRQLALYHGDHYMRELMNFS